MTPLIGETGGRGRLRACALALAMAGMAIAGCATSVPRRATGSSAGRQGQAWESVLPSARVVHAEAGDEFFRRDHALNARVEGPILASDEWPQADQPNLDRPRWIWFSGNERSYLFFRHGSRWPAW